MLTAAVAVLACAATAVGAPVAVTAVLGIALFAAPGYLLGTLLIGSHVAGLERLAVATGLAFCVPILGGLLLYAAGVPLHRAAWLGLLAGVTLAGDVLLLVRRGGARVASAGLPRRSWLPSSRHAAAFGAALVIAAGGLGLARIGASVQRYPGFTQLWLAHRDENATIANLGVGNHEGKAMQYRVVLLHNGHPASRWTFSLGSGRSWHQSPVVTGRYTITVDLFRLPDVTRPYRHVTLTGEGAPNS